MSLLNKLVIANRARSKSSFHFNFAAFKEFTPYLFTFDDLKIYDGSFSFRFVLDSLLSYTARSAATKLQLKFFKRQSVI